ncbi:MAG: PQQ-dependent dehydrogenase, methanol/ethanol family [Sphingomonadales bacterium]
MVQIRHMVWAAVGAVTVVAGYLAFRPPGTDEPAIDARMENARIGDADQEPHNWLAHGRTFGEQRFSPLQEINDGNVGRLALAWHYDLPTRRGLEATPIVVDGVMYTTGSWSMVHALDARTGALLWSWDPEVPRAWARYLCCDVVNRGPAVWRDKVFVATLDGRLVALEARTGNVVWTVQTTPRDRPYSITGAPRVINGRVVIGNGGAEYGVRGYVTAYDAETGTQAWRFYTVPGDPSQPYESPAMEMAAKTWTGDMYWRTGGGGTAWDSMAFDPDLNLLYVGVGNGSPWSREIRSPDGGDNLFLSSIVALDADSGKRVWHYQTTPGDNWDYTATQHIILADLNIRGSLRKVLMQAPKNGFFYVLDRATGELLSAEPYVHVSWASHVDRETGRPVENPAASYANRPALVYPGPIGGHNWQPMAFHPKTGLVYIPAMDVPFVYGKDNDFRYRNFTWNYGVDMHLSAPPEDPREEARIRAMLQGRLAAWDPINQREVWRVTHRGPWNGGVVATAGNLVFQGAGDGRLVAYRADTGERLWQATTQTGIVAAPMTYAVGGEQYIAVMAGWGGIAPLVMGPGAAGVKIRNISRVLAYKLDGTDELPPIPAEPEPPVAPALNASKKVIALGRKLFHLSCSNCHGAGVVGGGVISDLRHMDAETRTAFKDIVLGGILEDNGMASFADMYDETEVEAILAYIVKRARDAQLAASENEPRD